MTSPALAPLHPGRRPRASRESINSLDDDGLAAPVNECWTVAASVFHESLLNRPAVRSLHQSACSEGRGW